MYRRDSGRVVARVNDDAALFAHRIQCHHRLRYDCKVEDAVRFKHDLRQFPGIAVRSERALHHHDGRHFVEGHSESLLEDGMEHNGQDIKGSPRQRVSPRWFHRQTAAQTGYPSMGRERGIWSCVTVGVTVSDAAAT